MQKTSKKNVHHKKRDLLKVPFFYLDFFYREKSYKFLISMYEIKVIYFFLTSKVFYHTDFNSSAKASSIIFLPAEEK